MHALLTATLISFFASPALAASDCAPCESSRAAYEQEHQEYLKLAQEQKSAVAKLDSLSGKKNSPEYAAALKEADRITGELSGAREQSKQLLKEWQDNVTRFSQDQQRAKDEATREKAALEQEMEQEIERSGRATEDQSRRLNALDAEIKDASAAIQDGKRESQDIGRFEQERGSVRADVDANTKTIDARLDEADEIGLRPDADKRDQAGKNAPDPNPEQSKAKLDKVLEKDPKNGAALAKRAAANYQMGNVAAACSDAKAAQAVDPDDKQSYGIMRLACKEARDLKLKGKSKLLDKDPAALAKELEKNKMKSQPDQAQKPAPAPPPQPAAQAAAPAGSGSAPAPSAAPAGISPAGAAPGLAAPVSLQRAADSMGKYDQGSDFLGRGFLKEAIASLNEALALDPRNARALYSRSSANRALRNYKEAAADAAAGLEAAPNNLLLLNARSMALNRDKNYKEALAAADAALLADATDALAHANRAHALGGLGDREAMLSELRTAASLDPRFQGALDSALVAPFPSDVLFLYPGEKEELAAGDRARGAPAAPAAAARSPKSKALVAGLGALIALAALVAILTRPKSSPPPAPES
jgi:hypothetical protein